MAFDGITVACIRKELDEALTGGHIVKIAQPEKDELIFTIKNNRSQYRLLLSASASLPLAYLTGKNKKSPMTAPNFCMLLRKHIGSGKILSVEQPGLERILIFRIEHRNELGDLCRKKLIVELMGKHSNIIFTDAEDRILDAIKHISLNVSSVREVLPGRDYFIPNTLEKLDPLTVTEEDFYAVVCRKPLPVAKALYTGLTGFSPVAAEEICSRASIDGGKSAESLEEPERVHLYHTFDRLREDLKQGNFAPVIYYDGREPEEYAAIELTHYASSEAVSYTSVSELLEVYYDSKSVITRIRQKSTDLRRVVNTALERTAKKRNLQQKQMADTEKREKFRIYGELLNTYGYSAEPGAKSIDVINYYDGKEMKIPLDPLLSATENAKKYFNRYAKLKRTAEALEVQIAETTAELEHLRSVETSLQIALEEDDLTQIREELAACGYLKHRPAVQGKKKGKKASSKPLHYRTPEGFDIYVGKNNYQNEEISFHLANGGDWWFHAKGRPGSHVILRTEGREIPDQVFEAAGRLAAYYSSGRQAPKVEIDYTLRKNLRKPNGAKPGFVVYYTNYSLMAEPELSGLEEVGGR